MSPTYRSREEILACILECARFGTRKTQIMYRANLSHTQLESYLSRLLTSHLLSERIDPDGNGNAERIFETTELGTEFLRRYRALADLVPASQPLSNSRTSRRLLATEVATPAPAREDHRYRPASRSSRPLVSPSP